MPQAGHVGRPFAFGDRVAVGAQGGIALVGGQREGEVVDAVREGAVRRQPGIGDHPEDKRVLGHRLGNKGAEPPAARQGDQVLKQQRADAPVLHVIGDCEGDLRGRGTRAGPLIAAAAHHLAIQDGEQRRVVRGGLAADSARLLLGCHRAHAEETQVEVVWGHLGVHVPHRVEIAGPRGPDLDRGAVGQQGIGGGPGLCAHVTLPRILPRRRARFRNRPFSGVRYAAYQSFPLAGGHYRGFDS